MNLLLPFYVKVISRNEQYDFPVVLPFQLFQDNEGLVRQKGNDELNELLKSAYLTGSLFEGSLSNESGNIYFKDFEQFIASNSKSSRKLLEIGCGSGALLKTISHNFESAVGIEPGIGSIQTDDYEIISGFYPSDLIESDFDILIHFGVLEHIEDPYAFLESHHPKLTDNGIVIAAVPDCTDFLREGDISILFHEHFSYFNEDSLRALFIKCGFNPFNIQRFKGMLFIAARKGSLEKLKFEGKRVDLSVRINEKITTVIKCVNGFSDSEIAIYPCLRGINYMSLLGKYGVRLIDDSSELIGKIIPGFSKEIECFEQLSENPPKLILVTSKTYQKQILERIQGQKKLKDTKVDIL